MIRNFDVVFKNLIDENVPRVMLKSKEDRGGYVGKQATNVCKGAQPKSDNIFVRNYCEEY